MTPAQIKKWQRAALKTSERKDLDMRTRVALAKDMALWEIAFQFAMLNEILGKNKER